MSSSAPIGVLLVGVGDVPRSLLAAAAEILGPLSDVEAQCFQPTRKLDEVYQQIQESVERVDRGRGVLIIADLCGSTLANASYRLADQRPDCEVLCGANLPMLMKLFTADRQHLDARGLGESLAETGRRGINLCSDQRCGQAAVRAAQGEEEAP